MELTAKLGGTPKKNEFEKVDSVQPDAITLELVAQDGVQFGVVRCLASASGGRMIDNIVTNSILPALSRGILSRQIARKPVTEAVVSVADGEFAYDII